MQYLKELVYRVCEELQINKKRHPKRKMGKILKQVFHEQENDPLIIREMHIQTIVRYHTLTLN